MAFANVARVYELLCDPVRLARELPFLGPWCAGQEVLDLACGLGDHLAALLGAGLIPGGTGVDLSAAMLARARERHPDLRLAFRPGDLASVDSAACQRVLCLGNAVNCLPDPVAARAAVARLTAALPPGGRLLVQVTNPQRAGVDHGCVVRRSAAAVVVKTVVHAGDHSLLSLVLHERAGDGWSSTADHQTLLRLSGDDLLTAAFAGGARTAVLHGGLDGSAFAAADSADAVLDVTR